MSFIITIVVTVLTTIYYITKPIFNYVNDGKRKTVSAIQNDILKISATNLAEKIRERQISCLDVCKSYIDRIKEVNPLLNAVVQDRFREALKEAQTVDNYLAKSSLNGDDLKKIKPLLGVPVTIKESCSLQGCSLTVGSTTRIDFKAESDGEAVSRLKTSGAIPLLISTTPELCLSWETTNLVTGITRNAYDSTCSSGGSSGGEGALLGSGGSLVGIGTDIAGSIRLPSMFNGVFGHKPTPRLVPIKGHYPYCDDEKFMECLVIGPMARYAKDLRLMLRVLAGKKAADLKLYDEVDFTQLKIFYFVEENSRWFVPKVQNEIKLAVEKSVEHLVRKCGATKMDYKFEDIKNSIAVCGSYLYSINTIPNVLKPDNAYLGVEMVKSVFGYSKYSFNIMFFYLMQLIFRTFTPDCSLEVAKMRQEFREKLGTNGVLICPVWSTTAFKHSQSYSSLGSLLYLTFANVLLLPSTTVPCGFDKNGLPVGIQIIAGPNQDRLCIAVAEKLEEHFGGWQQPTHFNK